MRLNVKFLGEKNSGNALELVDENNQAICELWRRGDFEKELRYALLFAKAPEMFEIIKTLDSEEAKDIVRILSDI